jgi:hypothetical protein
MQDVPEQAKLVAQSALDAQVVLQVVPEHAKWFAQALALGKTQLPVVEHVPGSTTLRPEQLDAPHDAL